MPRSDPQRQNKPDLKVVKTGSETPRREIVPGAKPKIELSSAARQWRQEKGERIQESRQQATDMRREASRQTNQEEHEAMLAREADLKAKTFEQAVKDAEQGSAELFKQILDKKNPHPGDFTDAEVVVIKRELDRLTEECNRIPQKGFGSRFKNWLPGSEARAANKRWSEFRAAVGHLFSGKTSEAFRAGVAGRQKDRGIENVGRGSLTGQ
ncbi:TPA: hypothetical protein DF272_00635 [Candidatus Falkowbacteria bacterium]|nr:hypothetical protein [Candidatus Falkowbacteria bacterium]